MVKTAEAFRTISEVAGELNVQKHVLRFWEQKFTQVKPMKRGGGRRFYRPEDLELLRGIRDLLHTDGYTIKGVQRILREQGVDAVKRAGEMAESAAGDHPPVAAVPAKRRKRAAGRTRQQGGAAGRSKPAENQSASQSNQEPSSELGAARAEALADRWDAHHLSVVKTAISKLRNCRDLLTSDLATMASVASQVSQGASNKSRRA